MSKRLTTKRIDLWRQNIEASELRLTRTLQEVRSHLSSAKGGRYSLLLGLRVELAEDIQALRNTLEAVESLAHSEQVKKEAKRHV